MTMTVHEQLQKALDTLGMKYDATTPMIQSRIRRLKGEYKDQDQEKFEAIEQAEKTLLDYGDQLAELRMNDNEQKENKANQEKKKRNIPYKRIAVIGVPIILIVAIIGFVSMTIQARANAYEELESLMSNFRRYNYEEINEILDELPKNYRDTSSIREDYEAIMKEVNRIENGDPYVDYVEMREAYYRLLDQADDFPDWNLEGYFESVPNSVLLFGIRWVYEDYHFFIDADLTQPDEEHGIKIYPECVDIHLPSGFDATYYRYSRDNTHTYFGYMYYNDPEEVHIMYRILSIKEDELRVFVNGANRTFIMRPE